MKEHGPSWLGAVGLAAALAALAAFVAACTPSPTPTPTAAAAPRPSGIAPAAGELAAGRPTLAGGIAQGPSGIAVAGEGQVSGKPDIAYISIGVQTQAPTASQAHQENATAMDRVVARVRGLGIPEKDIRTSGLSLFPVMEKGERIIGYRATNNLTVTAADVGIVGKVLDEAVAAGANTAGSIRFGFKDEEKLRQQALEAAAKNARAKAEAIARGLDLQIKGVEAVQEEGVVMPMPVPRAMGAEFAPAAPPTPVMPGELTITARVRVTFSY